MHSYLRKTEIWTTKVTGLLEAVFQKIQALVDTGCFIVSINNNDRRNLVNFNSDSVAVNLVSPIGCIHFLDRRYLKSRDKSSKEFYCNNRNNPVMAEVIHMKEKLSAHTVWTKIKLQSPKVVQMRWQYSMCSIWIRSKTFTHKMNVKFMNPVTTK